eukprot:m.277382 g.277382  ORF g.277382 m.277382 type:complete len:403 (-) comp26933_c0_seq2:114-1322(-)
MHHNQPEGFGEDILKGRAKLFGLLQLGQAVLQQHGGLGVQLMLHVPHCFKDQLGQPILELVARLLFGPELPKDHVEMRPKLCIGQLPEHKGVALGRKVADEFGVAGAKYGLEGAVEAVQILLDLFLEKLETVREGSEGRLDNGRLNNGPGSRAHNQHERVEDRVNKVGVKVLAKVACQMDKEIEQRGGCHRVCLDQRFLQLLENFAFVDEDQLERLRNPPHFPVECVECGRKISDLPFEQGIVEERAADRGGILGIRSGPSDRDINPGELLRKRLEPEELSLVLLLPSLEPGPIEREQRGMLSGLLAPTVPVTVTVCVHRARVRCGRVAATRRHTPRFCSHACPALQACGVVVSHRGTRCVYHTWERDHDLTGSSPQDRTAVQQGCRAPTEGGRYSQHGPRV